MKGCSVWYRFGTLALALSMVVGMGCRRSTAVPDYDRLPQVLVLESVRALSEGDCALAARQLARLTEIVPESAAAAALLRESRDGVVLARADRLVAEGAVMEAVAELERAAGEYGDSDRLRRGRELLAALEAVAAYRAGEPYGSGAEIGAAVAALPEPTVFGGVAEYGRWLARQRAEAVRRQAEDDARLVAELLREWDVAVATDAVTADLAAARLRVVMRDLEGRVGDNALSGQYAMAGDIAAWSAYLRGGPEARRRMAGQFRDRQAASLTGRLLRVELAAWDGWALAATAEYSRLRRLLPQVRLRYLSAALRRVSATKGGGAPSVASVLEVFNDMVAAESKE